MCCRWAGRSVYISLLMLSFLIWLEKEEQDDNILELKVDNCIWRMEWRFNFKNIVNKIIKQLSNYWKIPKLNLFVIFVNNRWDMINIKLFSIKFLNRYVIKMYFYGNQFVAIYSNNLETIILFYIRVEYYCKYFYFSILYIKFIWACAILINFQFNVEKIYMRII